jgi:recombination DNA repair RAD52 pathway protein
MNNKPGGSNEGSNNHQNNSQKLFGNVEYTPEERLYLQSQLDEKVFISFLNSQLDETEISKRAGPGGGEVSYIETWRAIELANKVLGKIQNNSISKVSTDGPQVL